MNAYHGIHRAGILRILDRQTLADRLRSTRNTDRADALAYRNWLIWLGTYPLKPIPADHDAWVRRMQNSSRATLKLIALKTS